MFDTGSSGRGFLWRETAMTYSPVGTSCHWRTLLCWPHRARSLSSQGLEPRPDRQTLSRLIILALFSHPEVGEKGTWDCPGWMGRWVTELLENQFLSLWSHWPLSGISSFVHSALCQAYVFSVTVGPSQVHPQWILLMPTTWRRRLQSQPWQGGG